MTDRGMIKQGRGTVIGNAGEYLAVGELLRRNVVAAPAPRNTPGFDVLATNGHKSVNVRVKSKTTTANSWVWICAKDDNRTLFKGMLKYGDFTVLVDLKDEAHSPEYYVLSTVVLDKQLREDFKHWLETPGRAGRRHNESNRMYRFGHLPHHLPLLEESRGGKGWELILDFLESQD